MRIATALGVILLGYVISFAGSETAQTPPRSPLSPQEAIKHFRLADGFRIELAAAEPLIESPVAMTFDEHGRLWVVEMRDYPNGPAPGMKPEGRIRILADKDGDGRFDHSSIFADELLFANGILPWKDGVIVTAAPYIVWLRDTDGDGKADKREVLYEGFSTQNPQLRVSHPQLGIDNWIYVANGLRGGIIKAAAPLTPPSPPRGEGEKAIDLAGMDFRFDMIGNRQEAISGVGQYGNTFDEWGQRFVCDNRHHLRHIVIDNRYLKRNPYLAAPALVEDISVLKDGPLNSGGKVYPISKNWTTSSLHEGRFTAACGVYVARGPLAFLPATLGGETQRVRGTSAFTCDPTGNLVHAETMQQQGATFRAHPFKEGVEFLASPDDWFRPVFVTEGPDGVLYVVDMYRAVIEHPQFMPPELQKRPDLLLGKDRGRLWRIVPKDHAGSAAFVPPANKSTVELVRDLEHPGGWQRTTAQRLLLQRQDRAAVEPLRTLVQASKSPHGRIHAAWLLQGFAALEDKDLLRLCSDDHPRVREHAVLLAESRFAKSPALREAVLKLAEDTDPRVRFQVALTLGEWNDDCIVAPLAAIALSGADDPWTRLAVLSAVPERAGKLFRHLLDAKKLALKDDSQRLLILVEELASLMGGRRDPQEIETVLLTLTASEQRPFETTVLNGLARGMEQRGANLGTFIMTLPSIRNADSLREVALFRWFVQAMTRSAALARDSSRPVPERLDALRLLAHASWSTASECLIPLVKDEPLQDVRLAAVRAFASHPQPEVPRVLMESWRSYTPALRREVSEALLRQPARIHFLFDEMDAKRVKPGDLDAVQARRLLSHRDEKIRTRARHLLQDSMPAERKLVLAQYQQCLTLKGDPVRGREVFKKNCATCHRIAGIGTLVGPDIGDTRVKTPEALLNDILNPNQAIDNNYINYLVVTRSGKSLTGIITAENASSLTLQRAENQKDVVLRSDIEEIASSGVSLMPEGMEKNITPPQMADLISFLKNWRYLDGVTPLP